MACLAMMYNHEINMKNMNKMALPVKHGEGT